MDKVTGKLSVQFKLKDISYCAKHPDNHKYRIIPCINFIFNLCTDCLASFPRRLIQDEINMFVMYLRPVFPAKL